MGAGGDCCARGCVVNEMRGKQVKWDKAGLCGRAPPAFGQAGNRRDKELNLHGVSSSHRGRGHVHRQLEGRKEAVGRAK